MLALLPRGRLGAAHRRETKLLPKHRRDETRAKQRVGTMAEGPHRPMFTSARSEPLVLPVLRVVDAVTTRTHCPYCAFQCGMEVTTVTAADAVPRRADVRPDPAFPVNRGQMCIKGFTSGDLLDHPARLTAPLMRDARRAAGAGVLGGGARLRRREACCGCARRTAPAALAAFGSGALTNEKAYLLGKFARRGPALAEHRLQRPLLHVVGGGRPEQGLRHRPRAAVPGRATSRARRRCCCGARTRPTRCRRSCSGSHAAAAPAAG